jgi:dTDP-4-dehydrorhamnose reductase
MRILITGSRGQLGSQITDILKSGISELGPIPDDYRNAEILGTGSQEMDITNLNVVINYIREQRPEIVINAAAFTNVDACESNNDLAYRVNALGPRNLAIACENIGAKLIQISTDYVFDGNAQVPYREYDRVNPVNVYGKTKLAGEDFVREFSTRHFIIRTSWLYGYNGKNFVKTIIKAGKEKGSLDVVDDQRGNPTNAEDLIYHILKIALTEEYGIYHCTGKGECSWYDFACEIISLTGISCTVSPISSKELVKSAKRPSFSSLDHMMLRCTVGDEMRQWHEALEVYMSKVHFPSS